MRYGNAKAKEVSKQRGIQEIITCAWCGEEFPAGTPAHRADGQDRRDALARHAAVCVFHPLGEAVDLLREARKNLPLSLKQKIEGFLTGLGAELE